MSKTVYHYKVQSKSPFEFARESEIVGDAYMYAGWKETGLILDSDDFPTYMVFEWNHPGPPAHPIIDSASFLR